MVKLLLVEGGLGCLGNLDVDWGSTALSSLLLGDSSLLLLDKILTAGDFVSGRRLGVHTDNLVWQALKLDLLHTHLSSVLKVEPELGITDRAVLHETLAWVVLHVVERVNTTLTTSGLNDNLLLDLVLSLIAGSQAELHVVLDDDRLREGLSTNGEMVNTHRRVVIRVE